MYLGHGNHFGHTRSYSYVTLAKRKLVLVRLEIVLILMHDRCMVCTECNTGMEIALGTPELYSKVMYVNWKLVSVCFEVVLVLVQERCTVYAECTSGMETALGTPEWYS